MNAVEERIVAPEPGEQDAADALAVAICHAHYGGTTDAWRVAR